MIKFRLHIERPKVLFHLVSDESKNPANDYRAIRKELGAHSKEILKKPEYVFLSKSDRISKEEIKEKIKGEKRKNILTRRVENLGEQI